MPTKFILATIGTIVLVVLAGCSGTSPTPTEPVATGETPPTPNTVASNQEFPGWAPGNQTRFSNLSIGSEADLPDGMARHEYGIWNMRSSGRDITLKVWQDNRVVMNRTITFPPNGVLWLYVYKPANYTVAVNPENGSRFVTQPMKWDCNYRTWEIVVLPNGDVASQRYRTLIACGSD
jgi:hypothetical protein